jgi:hypothetical protein
VKRLAVVTISALLSIAGYATAEVLPAPPPPPTSSTATTDTTSTYESTTRPTTTSTTTFPTTSTTTPTITTTTPLPKPMVDAGGPYAVDEGGSVPVSASSLDPDVTYDWDLDDVFSFETTGQTTIFSAEAIDGPATRTIEVRVTKDASRSAVNEATVTIGNVAPRATFSIPRQAFAGFPFTIALTNVFDPSAEDTAAGFRYEFDCGVDSGDDSGFRAFPTASASCATTDIGPRTVLARITDKDDGSLKLGPKTVNVIVTFDSLCALTRSYSTDPSTTESLCAKLQNASAASTDTAREGLLVAYRNELDALTGTEPGKAFTTDQAEILRKLSFEVKS